MNQLPLTDGQRSVRDIILNIEAVLKRNVDVAPRANGAVGGKAIHRSYPTPFTADQLVALEVAVDELGSGFTVEKLLDKANALDPTIRLKKGGEVSFSIKTFMAERGGLRVKWADKPAFGSTGVRR